MLSKRYKSKRKLSDSALWQKPNHPQKIQKATWQHKNATKNLDNTTIADRLRTVSWSNNSHPTGVVRPVYERWTTLKLLYQFKYNETTMLKMFMISTNKLSRYET